MFKLSAVLLSALCSFDVSCRWCSHSQKHTHIYKKFHCASFLASVQAEDSPSFSSCLGKQSVFCKGVRQKDKQFVVTIVLPANPRDLAVLSKQLAVGHKDTFCDPHSSSFIATEPQTQKIFTTLRYPVIKSSDQQWWINGLNINWFSV